jgi:UDP-N-acetylglucosamine--N-acetylmuramyl-(pentapeptide) pyrophosphoryl-undecaprenol N-acetylglucosamine transferase
MNRILIATGGTGGHIYPALVTGQELRARGWDVCFIGKFGSARSKLTDAGFAVIDIQAEGFMSRGFVQKIRSLGFLIKNFCVCAHAVIHFRPKVVLGFGGYSSFPTVFSA